MSTTPKIPVIPSAPLKSHLDKATAEVKKRDLPSRQAAILIELAEYGMQVEAMEKERGQLASENAKLRADLAKLQADAARRTSAAKDAQAALDAEQGLRAEIHRLKGEKAALLENVDTLTKRHLEIGKQIRDLAKRFEAGAAPAQQTSLFPAAPSKPPNPYR